MSISNQMNKYSKVNTLLAIPIPRESPSPEAEEADSQGAWKEPWAINQQRKNLIRGKLGSCICPVLFSTGMSLLKDIISSADCQGKRFVCLLLLFDSGALFECLA